jgi:hypothetical protein
VAANRIRSAAVGYTLLAPSLFGGHISAVADARGSGADGSVAHGGDGVGADWQSGNTLSAEGELG